MELNVACETVSALVCCGKSKISRSSLQFNLKGNINVKHVVTAEKINGVTLHFDSYCKSLTKLINYVSCHFKYVWLQVDTYLPARHIMPLGNYTIEA